MVAYTTKSTESKRIQDNQANTLVTAGLVEKTEAGKYCVPWDEFTATVRLAS